MDAFDPTKANSPPLPKANTGYHAVATGFRLQQVPVLEIECDGAEGADEQGGADKQDGGMSRGATAALVLSLIFGVSGGMFALRARQNKQKLASLQQEVQQQAQEEQWQGKKPKQQQQQQQQQQNQQHGRGAKTLNPLTAGIELPELCR